MALGVDGVRVGTWTSPGSVSGCTVILPPPGTVGALAVRGAAPGTREAAALSAQGKVAECHGVVLSGGSAFGLASADGVVRWLEQQGIGYRVRDAVVPIVGAAILLDGSVADRSQRPDADAGHAACVAASGDEPPEGSVGAGAGCSVAKVGGLAGAWRGGQGTVVLEHDGVIVAALVANNALGEIVDVDGSLIASARVDPAVVRYPYAPIAQMGAASSSPNANTVIGCIVTNAVLDKQSACRVADLAHSGVARAVRPAHTDFDGDALFCLATGEAAATVDLVAHMAADAVAAAARRGVQLAASANGLPGLAGDPP